MPSAAGRTPNPSSSTASSNEVNAMPAGPEWFIVLAVVLIIFGGSQLPKLARNLGKAQKEFKEGFTAGELETAKVRTDS
jgi:sec-independent protein translocase protein TatA